jgi:hypothetical protein
MGWRHRVQGGVLALIGYLLSPLSWWNDALINVPLAMGFAWVVSAFYRPAFEAALVMGYWLTNVLGLVLLHVGTRRALASGPARRYTAREVLRDLGVSLLYTLLLVCLVRLKVLQPLADYWPSRPPQAPVTIEKRP